MTCYDRILPRSLSIFGAIFHLQSRPQIFQCCRKLPIISDWVLGHLSGFDLVRMDKMGEYKYMGT
jgi:hypothetical protein